MPKRSFEKESKLNQALLKELLFYYPKTGVFIWNARAPISRANKIFNGHHAGKPAGVTCPRGYCYIKFRGLGLYSAGRLAWLYVYGSWPKDEIDHINGNPSDNRIKNLREASRSENGANRRKHVHNKSGFKGVYAKRGKWTADVRMNNKRYRLGSFNTPEEAYAAYLKKAKEVHGEFAKT